MVGRKVLRPGMKILVTARKRKREWRASGSRALDLEAMVENTGKGPRRRRSDR